MLPKLLCSSRRRYRRAVCEPGTHCIPFTVYCVICRVRPTNSKFRVSCEQSDKKKKARKIGPGAPSGVCCSGWISAIRSVLCYQSFSAPRDADTAERYANIPFALRMGVRSLWVRDKRKTPHKVVFFILWCTFRDSNPGPTD